jgi:23S rRNA (pseudouridine1915-N3)-methyltransferase
MNINSIGKTDNKEPKKLIDDYAKRLSFYIKFDLEIIPDIKCQNLSEKQQKKKEGELILAKVAATDQLILLDENEKTSQALVFRRVEK